MKQHCVDSKTRELFYYVQLWSDVLQKSIIKSYDLELIHKISIIFHKDK